MKEFLRYLEKNPFIGNQESCGIGIHYWNADYWTIEVTRYLIERDKYTIHSKFKGNRFADPNRIRKDGNIKLSVKNILQKIKDSADCLLVCEVGRGLDIVVSNQVKKWKKIYCYDHVNYKEYLKIFNNVEFIHTSTSVFNPEIIKEKCIMIMNHSLYRDLDRFKNDNIIHAIVDGEQKW